MRLSYELELNEAPDVGDAAISFAEETIRFECSYPRVVDVEAVDFNVTSNLPTEPIQHHGFMTYEMVADVGEVGDMTTVTITPKHAFADRIFAK